MSRLMDMKASALGLVLAGAAVAAVGAQGPGEPHRYLTMGLMTVGATEAISFNVSFDDHSEEPPATVQLNLFDHSGTLMKSKVATLAPGQSATLVLKAPGKYRAQAVDLNPPSSPNGRRSLVGCAEVSIDEFTTVKRVVCLHLPRQPVDVGP